MRDRGVARVHFWSLECIESCAAERFSWSNCASITVTERTIHEMFGRQSIRVIWTEE